MRKQDNQPPAEEAGKITNHLFFENWIAKQNTTTDTRRTPLGNGCVERERRSLRFISALLVSNYVCEGMLIVVDSRQRVAGAHL
jgi:hypothetical protein